MTPPDHASRAHALLSASGAHRWLACTPSALLESREPDKSSAFAAEGTLAHELCEMYLRGKEADADKRFDSDMHTCARAYLDYTAEKAGKNSTRIVEERVDFSAYVPGGFGTCDCLLINDSRLTIIDFKYGKGVQVDAENNPQLMLYALGALDLYGIAYDFKDVELCIFQPRLNHISEWNISISNLMQWAEEILKPRAALAVKGKGIRVAGEHCKFCRYAPKCETLTNLCTQDFDEVIEDLSPERIADIIAREKVITSWLKSVKSYALKQMFEKPDAIPGFKLVEGATKRRYADVEKIKDTLLNAGYTNEDIYEPEKLIGITDMTKLLGKKRFNELLGDLVEKPKGAPTIAPISDKRQPIDPSSVILNDFNEGD